MQKFEDLRFSIGLFFLIVGLLLLVAGFTQLDQKDAAVLNFRVGAGLCVFGTSALIVALRSA